MEEQKLLKKGLTLEYITLGWNIVGCVILAFTAYYAHSVALVGFGIDSAIEIFASVVVVWQLRATHKNDELKALKFIGTAFMLLAVYISIQSIFALVYNSRPQQSVVGIIWLTLTVIAMFLLAYGKLEVGKKLQHNVLQAEAKVTLVDGILASVVLISLLLNFFFGIWIVDILAGFIIAGYSFIEGLHAWKEVH